MVEPARALISVLTERAGPTGPLFDGLCRAGDDDGHHWFFQRGSVLRYASDTDSVVLPFAPITRYWPLLAGTPFEAGVDACYTSYHRPHGFHWLFVDGFALQYDLAAGVVLKEPAPIGSIFTLEGRESAFAQGVDAVCPPAPEDGEYWFFRRGQMLKYHTRGSGVVASAAPVAKYWPGLAQTVFAKGVDACHTTARSHHWLFAGNVAAKYDSTKHLAVAGPAPVVDLLPALLDDLGQTVAVGWV
jgi:hypothetical protein